MFTSDAMAQNTAFASNMQSSP